MYILRSCSPGGRWLISTRHLASLGTAVGLFLVLVPRSVPNQESGPFLGVQLHGLWAVIAFLGVLVLALGLAGNRRRGSALLYVDHNSSAVHGMRSPGRSIRACSSFTSSLRLCKKA